MERPDQLGDIFGAFAEIGQRYFTRIGSLHRTEPKLQAGRIRRPVQPL